MNREHLDSLLDLPFSFSSRPAPLPADLRPEWGIAALLLILRKCWGGRAALKHLHVINSALRTEQSRQMLLDVVQGIKRPQDTPIRFDPSLNRAIQFAIGEGLVAVRGATIGLTNKGQRTTDQVFSSVGCLEVEKAFLDAIGGRITQKHVDAILTWGGELR